MTREFRRRRNKTKAPRRGMSHAVAGRKGGQTTAKNMTALERKSRAHLGAVARWKGHTPKSSRSREVWIKVEAPMMDLGLGGFTRLIQYGKQFAPQEAQRFIETATEANEISKRLLSMLAKHNFQG